MWLFMVISVISGKLTLSPCLDMIINQNTIQFIIQYNGQQIIKWNEMKQ